MNITKRILTGVFAVCAAFLFMTGCAVKGPAVHKEPAAAAEEAKKSAGQLTLVSVVGLGNSVLVEADGLLKYTAFKLSGPPRVAIDMPGVGIAGVQGMTTVNNNFITDIKVSATGEGDNKIARIEVGIRSGVNHDIKAGDDSLLIDFSAETYIPGVSAPEKIEEEPVAAESVPVAMAEPAVAAEPAPEAAPAEVIPGAKNIISVATSSEDGVTVVRLTGDGQFGNYNSFGLDSPARMVLDIWGVGTSVAKKEVGISGAFVKKMRIGAHPDKTRVVFDSKSKKVPAYTIEKDGYAIVVRFGADAAKISAQEAASSRLSAPAQAVATPAAIPEPAKSEVAAEVSSAEGELVEIKSVNFRKVSGNGGMLSIATSGMPVYKVIESSEGLTLTLDISDAAIPEELKMTLDASELNTVVSSISSFEPSEAGKNVRVLVNLNEKATYTVKESNGTINVAFAASPAAKAAEAAAEAPAKTMAAAKAPKAEVPVGKPLEDAALQPKKYKGPKIDIDMIDAQITDILKLLAEVRDINIVASEDVRGTITLRLKSIPWEQVFDLVLQTKGLDSIEEGNVIRVAPRDRLRKEKEELLAAKKAEEKQEDLQTEYVRINYDKASTLAPQIKSVLSDRGVPTVHEATNTLIIRDTKAGIAAAKDYIKQVDKPTPQVLIEARIVEAETSFARDLGIQWGIDTRATHSSNVHTTMFGSSDQLGSAIPDPGVQSAPIATTPVTNQAKTGFAGDVGVSNYAVNLPATGTAGTLGALGFILGKTGANPMLLDLRISAGEQQGHVKTISRPRIITMNNKEAKIEQGESIPFETASASGTATSFIDANLSLTVTPQITPDGSVLMSIKASRNSIGSFRTSAGKPSINKKEATTNVLVKNGETTVIGGIIVSDSSTSERGIPLLKDIPVLGWLFKAKSISDSQKELLIFITPTIVEEEAAG